VLGKKSGKASITYNWNRWASPMPLMKRFRDAAARQDKGIEKRACFSAAEFKEIVEECSLQAVSPGSP